MAPRIATPEELDAVLKPYGPKARKFAKRNPKDDARLNILEGAVRSGKTWAIIPKFIQLFAYPVKGKKVITGVSKQTIYNNVLDDLFSVIGPRNYSYNRQSGELEMFGSQWLVIGAKDEGSEKYVRGLTVGVWVADELTLQPESFVMMLMNRMSPEGARGYATTNPDNPFHYVKTKILDNTKLRDSGMLWSEHFVLDDNPYLTEDYKKFLGEAYTGVYYLRYIKGLWVVAEGAIYGSCWSDSLMYEAMVPTAGRAETIACDYGTDHPHVYLHTVDDGVNIWFQHEYVWDSKREMRQKTNTEYADDLEEFLKLAPGAKVIVPPEAASFSAELTQRGIWHTDADNSVAEGIQTVSAMMALKRLRFRVSKQCRGEDRCRCGTQCCVRTVRRIPTYAWDPKKGERGLEEPIKKNDDECDAVRYAVKTEVAAWRLLA